MAAFRAFAAQPLAWTRLAIGLGQGIALYFLYVAYEAKTWPAISGQIFVPLLLVFWFVPLIAVVGVGNLRTRELVLWLIVATLICAGLGWHDIARGEAVTWPPLNLGGERLYPSGILFISLTAGLLIAHSLIAPASSEQRWVAPYPALFDAAWKHGLQVVLAIGFVGLFWGMLWLGAGLFTLIKINLFREIIEKRWFAIPVSALALAAALHVTDVRAGLVRGVRTLALTLLSWLLPLMALIVGAFLFSLFFTGLEPLWSTRHAAYILLTATVVLIVLINAAWQDGEAENRPDRVRRYTATLAALLLTPLVLLAAFGLSLRVGQYGWTTDRIILGTALAVAACYASFYAWAVLMPGPWLARLPTGNVVAAYATLGALLALLSPIADPARLAVNNQVARLASGRVSPDKFDFAFLRFEGARYGQAALARLQAEGAGPDPANVKQRAEQAARMTSRYVPANLPRPLPPDDLSRTLSVYPSGKVLPEAFAKRNWSTFQPLHLLPGCLLNVTVKCDAIVLDLDGNGADEIVVIQPPVRAVVFRADAANTWSPVGNLTGLNCPGVTEGLRSGRSAPQTPRWMDIEVAGQTLSVTANCR